LAQTLSNADAALKEWYLPGVRGQLNDDVPLLQQVERNTRDIEGRRAVLSLNTKRNSGVGARPDDGTLPTAGQQTFAEERVPLKYNYARGTITGPAIRASKSDKGSFARLLRFEMERMTADLKRDVNRQLWGNADGKIATLTVNNNTTVLSLATATSAVQMRQLEVGMVVDIGTVAAPTSVLSATTISAVDSTNKKITVGTACTTATTDFVFRSGSVGVSVCHEVTGMQKIVDDSGTLFNVDPDTHPSWKAIDAGNSGTNRAISENLIAKNVHDIQIAGGTWPNLGIASDGVHRAFANLLTSLKRFPGTRELKGGYMGLDFSAGGPNIPIVWDRDCPANSLYLVTTKHLIEFVNGDWDMGDEDGSVLSRVSNKDSYEFFLYRDHELATDKRNAHGRVVDITEAS
jgi:hypothetical protein